MTPFFRIWLLLSLLLSAANAIAAPCTDSSSACTEWVSPGKNTGRSLIYRTFPLSAKNERITRALIVVHDTTRDAANYFQTAVASAFLAGALEDTLVIVPRFASNNASCADAVAAGEINWPCEGNSWRSGGIALGSAVTSFDLMDDILRRVAMRATFPSLSTIVVAGHSAGGQFVTRYEMANAVHDTLGVRIQYVVANPSSYAYPDNRRPMNAGGRLDFSPYPERSCGAFNVWPYGLEKRTGYAIRESVSQLRKQLAMRPTTYLLGQLDTLPNEVFDSSCAAMAQGSTRLARGQAFVRYVNDVLKGRHTMTVVPLCGHNVRCMFTADVALRALFPPLRPEGARSSLMGGLLNDFLGERQAEVATRVVDATGRER